MYTKESLAKVNGRFLGTHYALSDSDVDKANEFVELIESTRSEIKPMPGDVILLTNHYGEYYPHARLEFIGDDRYGGNVCERASTYISKEDDGIVCNSSGGAWCNVPVSKLKYVGTTGTRFWFFGHCGACADGGIDIYANVSLWEYKDPEWKSEYTTKDYDKVYISYSPKEEDNYHWRVTRESMSHCAFETKEDYKAWLHTYRGVVEKGNLQNQYVAWIWKQENHGNLSPAEYDALDLPEDTMMMNGLRRCKRKYDKTTHTVHTYYVWYWNEDTDEHYSDRYMRQNELRKAYEIDWKEGRKPYELAKKELGLEV